MTNSFHALCVAALLFAGSAAHASRTIHETHEAGPHATVDINGVSGTLDVSGWDKPSVEVFGTVGADVDRVDVSGDSNHVSVQIVTRTVRLWGMDGNVHLSVRVPAAASVSTTVVSADLHTTGLSGEVELHTVSGNITGEVGGNLRAKTVSGEVRLKAPAAKSFRISTVSGNIQASGGDGESDVGLHASGRRGVLAQRIAAGAGSGDRRRPRRLRPVRRGRGGAGGGARAADRARSARGRGDEAHP